MFSIWIKVYSSSYSMQTSLKKSSSEIHVFSINKYMSSSVFFTTDTRAQIRSIHFDFCLS